MFSTRKYERLLVPALILSVGLHLVAALVPEKAVLFVVGSRDLSVPPTCLEVVPLSPDPVPVYREKKAGEKGEYQGQILPPPQPRPRLNFSAGDSAAWLEIYLPDIFHYGDTELSSRSSGFQQEWSADSVAAIDSYIAEIYERISRAKRYPLASRKLGQEGEVTVGFAIKRNGTLEGEAKLIRACPYELLNRAACKSIRRSAPFPPLPEFILADPFFLTVRIVYKLKR